MNGMTLFSGFGGADIGMTDASIEIVAGIEYDAEIAAVAQANGHPVTVADVRHVDPADYLGLDIEALHASPVCTRASVANNSAERDEETRLKEAPLDIECAEATVRFIETLQPKIFTLENVWQYRRFQSFKGGKKFEGILPALERLGYWVDVQHVNAADFGVPQTRKRMIVRAIKGGWVPMLPEPERWVGWYEAIEDLIPTLPESQFAPWQLERLPEELKTSIIVSNQASYDHNAENYTCYGMMHREANEPATTMRTTFAPTAFLMAGGGNTNFAEAYTGKGVRYGEDPSPTITTVTGDGGAMPRAFLISPVDATTKEAHEPATTLMSSDHTIEPRAFLVHPTDQRSMPIIDQDDPTFTVMSNQGNLNLPRAFLAAGGNATKDNCARLAEEPSWTVASVERVGNIPRAWLSQGRVVKMTPRALARFQTFPDSYKLPDRAALACKGIGNAVPPLMMEKIYKQLIEAAQ